MADMMLLWPNAPSLTTTSTQPAANVHRLDATADEFAVIMYAEEGCTITNVAWLQGDTSDPSTASPGTLRIGLQSVGTDGLPTGTWLASGNGYVDKSTWSNGDDGLYITSTLGSSVTLSRGDAFAIVLKPQATGTWGASNWADIGYFATQDTLISTPYVVTNGSKINTGRTPNTIVRSSSRTYGYPYQTVGFWNIDSDVAGQANDEVGIKFSLPSSMCDTYKISGIMLFTDMAIGSSFAIKLFEGTNRTALQSVTIDSDVSGTASGNGQNFFYFDESTLSSLSAGTTYRLMIEALSTTAAGPIRYVDLATSGDMTAYIGTQATLEWTEWTGTSYTDTATRIPNLSLIISDVTEPSGGGGAYPIFGGMVVK